MPGAGCKRTLANRPGKKVPGRGKVKRIRTVVPKKGRYIHVRVVSKKGKRGGTTVAGGVQKTKRSRAKARRAVKKWHRKKRM